MAEMTKSSSQVNVSSKNIKCTAYRKVSSCSTNEEGSLKGLLRAIAQQNEQKQTINKREQFTHTMNKLSMQFTSSLILFEQFINLNTQH